MGGDVRIEPAPAEPTPNGVPAHATPLVMRLDGRAVATGWAFLSDGGETLVLGDLNGSGGGRLDVARHALRIMPQVARGEGARRVRFYTHRPGMIRAARREGYRCGATIDGKTCVEVAL